MSSSALDANFTPLVHENRVLILQMIFGNSIVSRQNCWSLSCTVSLRVYNFIASCRGVLCNLSLVNSVDDSAIVKHVVGSLLSCSRS